MAKSIIKAQRAWERDKRSDDPIVRAQAAGDLIRAYLYGGLPEQAKTFADEARMPGLATVTGPDGLPIALAHAWRALATFDVGLEFGRHELLERANTSLSNVATVVRLFIADDEPLALVGTMRAITEIGIYRHGDDMTSALNAADAIPLFVSMDVARKHPVLPILAAEAMDFAELPDREPGVLLRTYAPIVAELNPEHPLRVRYDRIDARHPEPTVPTKRPSKPVPKLTSATGVDAIRAALALRDHRAALGHARGIRFRAVTGGEDAATTTERHTCEAWIALAHIAAAFDATDRSERENLLGAAVDGLARLTNEDCALAVYGFAYALTKVAFARDDLEIETALDFFDTKDFEAFQRSEPYAQLLLIDAYSYAQFPARARGRAFALSRIDGVMRSLSEPARRRLRSMGAGMVGPPGSFSLDGIAAAGADAEYNRFVNLVESGDFIGGYHEGIALGIRTKDGIFASWPEAAQEFSSVLFGAAALVYALDLGDTLEAHAILQNIIDLEYFTEFEPSDDTELQTVFRLAQIALTEDPEAVNELFEEYDYLLETRGFWEPLYVEAARMELLRHINWNPRSYGLGQLIEDAERYWPADHPILTRLYKLDGREPAALVPAPNAVAVSAARAELDGMIGLDGFKEHLDRLERNLLTQQRRAAAGLHASGTNGHHLVFTGNPGTGKTSAARLVGLRYKELGLLEHGHLVEVDRSGLVGRYIGESEGKTAEVLKSALGGVLLIDEAYALQGGEDSSNRDFGHRVVETVLKFAEDHREELVIILTGYPEKMAAFLDMNPGLRSRFSRVFEFEDFTNDQLIEMFTLLAASTDYDVTPEAEAELRSTLESLTRDEHFGNGRLIRDLFERARERHGARVSDFDDPTVAELRGLTAEDLPPVSELDLGTTIGRDRKDNDPDDRHGHPQGHSGMYI